ncbi:protein phosphatase [Ophiostoma piceae UAMH 11346]|uniref:Protein phosphatase n=1 Tax=Ophiostoma piceae (strain UAMH 11346) TaxID=1262450 RepID=S3C8M7_OPHP1|nr:protein phosphatase [Ophiostoma piceae UAMH 11346]
MDVKLTVENVHALASGTSTLGTLKLTNFHIIFSAPVPAPPPPPPKDDTPNDKPHPAPPVRYRESWITYPIISLCTFRPTPAASGIPSSIRLRCRDFNYVCFNFADDKQAREAFEFIRNRTCRLGSIEKLYAFSYTPPRQEKEVRGWAIYDTRAEFRRQGISEKLPDRGWRISTINKDYSFSPTYPDILVVPSKISDNVLKYAGQFRSRARIPALSYYHPITQCSITRSSQPLVGVRNNRSIQDERLVSACFYKSTAVFNGSNSSEGSLLAAAANNDAASSVTKDSGSSSADTVIVSYEGTVTEAAAATEEAADVTRSTTVSSTDDMDADDTADDQPGSRIVGARRDNLIVDARPQINSYAMQVIGKGSENMDHYKSATKVFLSIDNIHVMRDSLNKVIDAVKDADVSPLAPNQDLLAKSGWLKHIKGILVGSATIARQVGVLAAHVLIHCSDGWDRTSQLSALSQIMLDPYYRTIDGFIVLVEKDWLSFGHMFQQRTGHLNSEKWFVTQYDAMAGTKIEPGDGDSGRNEVFDNAVASARRFFKKSLSQEKDDSDADGAGDDSSINNVGSSNGKGASSEESQATRPREISPVFHQFLDATYQLVRQHPTRFEFNERFLRRLLYHLYSCQYGTFLYNNERQRRDAKVHEQTASVWDYFLSRRQEFINPKYDASIDSGDRQQERLIFPKLDEIRWWHQVFNRTDQDMNGALNEQAAALLRAAEYQATLRATAPATIVVTSEDDASGATNAGPAGANAGGLDSVSSLSSQSTSPRRGASPIPLSTSSASHPQPQPPSFQTSQSATGEPESSTEASVPNANTARSMLATPVDPPPPSSFNRSSSSASETSAFAALRDGIAGLGIGQKVGGVLGSLGAVGSIGKGTTASSGSAGALSSDAFAADTGSAPGASTKTDTAALAEPSADIDTGRSVPAPVPAPVHASPSQTQDVPARSPPVIAKSNINGREALFGIAAVEEEESSVFDSFIGSGASRKSRQSNRSSVEQEMRDV